MTNAEMTDRGTGFQASSTHAYPDLCLGCGNLDTILQRRPVHDPGVAYNMFTLISMRRDQLFGLLTAMGQHTTTKSQLD